MSINEFPLSAGTYVLIGRVDRALTLAVGRLGTVTLAAGDYAYIGSAHGPGGLRARLSRHLRHNKPLHWHIDYLTAAAPIRAIWLRESSERLECAWAQALITRGTVSVPGFGSSDCTCPAHLVALAEDTIPAEIAPVTVIKLGHR